jgi:hypothetical protein
MAGLVNTRIHRGPHDWAIEPDVCPYEERLRQDPAAAHIVACVAIDGRGRLCCCPAYEWYARDPAGRRRVGDIATHVNLAHGGETPAKRGVVMCRLAKATHWDVGAL